MILDKWDYRITIIQELLLEFAKESNLGVYTGTTQQKDKCLQDLWRVFNHPNCAIVYTQRGFTITGFAVLFLDDLFIDVGMFGVVSRFYIQPQYRGTLASRDLAQQCIEWFNSKRVSSSTVTSTNIGNPKLLENLFKKYGYSITGTVLEKKHEYKDTI